MSEIGIFVLGIKQSYMEDYLVVSNVKILDAANVVGFQAFSAAKIYFVRQNIFITLSERTIFPLKTCWNTVSRIR